MSSFKPLFYIFAMALTGQISGCATIVGGGGQTTLHIRTNPKNAQVTVTNRKGKEVFHGASPTQILVRTGAGYFTPAEYTVRISAPGYAERTVKVTCKINGWYFGNLLLGGGLGMLVIDPLSGAMWKLKDPLVDESLDRSTTFISPSLQIMTPGEVPENLKDKLVKVE